MRVLQDCHAVKSICIRIDSTAQSRAKSHAQLGADVEFADRSGSRKGAALSSRHP